MQPARSNSFDVVQRQYFLVEINTFAHPFDHASNLVIYGKLTEIKRHQCVLQPTHDDKIHAGHRAQ